MGQIAHGMIDADLAITDIDQTYAALLGLSPQAAIGRSVLDVLHPDDRAASALLLRHALNGGATLSATQRHLHADGHPVWVHLSVSRLAAGDGQRLVVTCWPLPPRDDGPSTVAAQWQVARLLLGALDDGKRAFGETLIGNPATEILLVGYVAEAEARTIAASEVADRIGVTWALTKRWLAALVEAGFIEAEVPEPIGPETPIRLSSRALTLLETIFGTLLAIVRRHPASA